MIVSKTLKLTTLLIAMVGILPTLASYTMSIPLETTKGGALPNGSINFGDKDSDGNGESPANNCLYDNKNYIILVTEAQPDRHYEVGDMIFVAGERTISYYSPSNSKFPKPGLSRGKEMESYSDETYFEICGDNLENYPIMGGVDSDYNPELPDDDQTGPDWTPECLPLDTINNYAAYDKVAREYEYHSTTYGLDHVRADWTYKPADYDPNRPGSYQYLPEASDTVSGPNPNYEYNAICRVNKRLE